MDTCCPCLVLSCFCLPASVCVVPLVLAIVFNSIPLSLFYRSKIQFLRAAVCSRYYPPIDRLLPSTCPVLCNPLIPSFSFDSSPPFMRYSLFSTRNMGMFPFPCFFFFPSTQNLRALNDTFLLWASLLA
ncbi:MAG: hypothetical protein JOS17DRAFT_731845 [Linnemannia elongata]|nr:MAG: hypothetical protein JOS17DRAFT_731845 [Linnemannia elongata]